MSATESTQPSYPIPLTNAHELIATVIFDPLVEQKRIDQIIRDEGLVQNYDLRRKRTNELLDELAKSLIGTAVESYSELHARIRGAGESAWGMETAQKVNSAIYPGFEISEAVDQRAVAELCGWEKEWNDVLSIWKERGHLDKQWIPIDTIDALCVSSGIGALAAREQIPIGRNVVDLGGGTGSWGFVLAQLGFDVTLIERDARLIEQFEITREALQKRGVRTGNIHALHGEFHAEDEKNSPAIRSVLQNADIMVCYPYEEQVRDRLRLFQHYGKPSSLLVLYGGALDDFMLNVDFADKYGVSIVGQDIRNKVFKNIHGDGHRYVRGFDASRSGSNWIMLQKMQPSTNQVRIGQFPK